MQFAGGNQECEKFCCIFKPQFFSEYFFCAVKVLDRAIGFSVRLYIEETTSGLQGGGGAVKNMQEWKGKKTCECTNKN